MKLRQDTENRQPFFLKLCSCDFQRNNKMKDEEILKAKINGECGKLLWSELEKHFARGVVLKVDGTMDLIDVAVEFTRDNKARVTEWLESGVVAKVTDDDAIAWHESDAIFWSVVVAPWVMVQLINEAE